MSKQQNIIKPNCYFHQQTMVKLYRHIYLKVVIICLVLLVLTIMVFTWHIFHIFTFRELGFFLDKTLIDFEFNFDYLSDLWLVTNQIVPMFFWLTLSISLTLIIYLSRKLWIKINEWRNANLSQYKIL